MCRTTTAAAAAAAAVCRVYYAGVLLLGDLVVLYQPVLFYVKMNTNVILASTDYSGTSTYELSTRSGRFYCYTAAAAAVYTAAAAGACSCCWLLMLLFIVVHLPHPGQPEVFFLLQNQIVEYLPHRRTCSSGHPLSAHPLFLRLRLTYIPGINIEHFPPVAKPQAGVSPPRRSPPCT